MQFIDSYNSTSPEQARQRAGANYIEFYCTFKVCRYIKKDVLQSKYRFVNVTQTLIETKLLKV